LHSQIHITEVLIAANLADLVAAFSTGISKHLLPASSSQHSILFLDATSNLIWNVSLCAGGTSPSLLLTSCCQLARYSTNTVLHQQDGITLYLELTHLINKKS
jgi:hypothetical protein